MKGARPARAAIWPDRRRAELGQVSQEGGGGAGADASEASRGGRPWRQHSGAASKAATLATAWASLFGLPDVVRERLEKGLWEAGDLAAPLVVSMVWSCSRRVTQAASSACVERVRGWGRADGWRRSRRACGRRSGRFWRAAAAPGKVANLARVGDGKCEAGGVGGRTTGRSQPPVASRITGRARRGRAGRLTSAAQPGASWANRALWPWKCRSRVALAMSRPAGGRVAGEGSSWVGSRLSLVNTSLGLWQRCEFRFPGDKAGARCGTGSKDPRGKNALLPCRRRGGCDHPAALVFTNRI